MVSSSRTSGYLLFPSPIRDGEDLFGYILRRAERAGSGTIHAVAKAAGIARSEISFVNASRFLPRLAEILREDVERLRAAAIVSAEEGSWLVTAFGGQQLRRKTICEPEVRICPRCLQEDGHIHGLWQIAALSECPRHAISLVSTCHACRRPLRWKRRRLMHCSCGADFRDAPCVASPSYTLALSREIARRATGERGELFVQADGDRAQSLQSFIDLCMLMGASVQGDGFRKVISGRLRLDEARKILQAAGTILLEPEENGYFRYLDSIFVEPKSRCGQLAEMFPKWRKALRVYPALSCLRPGIYRYLRQRHPKHFEALSYKVGIVGEELATLSLDEAARRIGRTRESTLALAEKLGIEVIVAEAGPRAARRRMRKEDFARLADTALHGKELLPLHVSTIPGVITRRSRRHGGAPMMIGRQAEGLWSKAPFLSAQLGAGISEPVFIPARAVGSRLAADGPRLMLSGFFSRFSGAADAGTKSGIALKTLAAFEQALRERITTAPRPQAKLMSIADAVTRRLRRFGTPLGSVLADLLDGKLGPVWHDGRRPGLRGILVRYDAIIDYARTARRNRLGEFLSRADVMVKIEGRSGLVAHLRRRKLIRTVRHPSAKGTFYDRESVEAFCRTYISLAQICRAGLFPDSSSHPTFLRRDLATRFGLAPVMAPEIDGTPLVYYKREQVERAAASTRPVDRRAA